MRRALLALCVAALVGCASDAVDPLRPGPKPPPDVTELPPAVVTRPPPTCDEAIGRPIVRRLTSTQLRNTLEDLFESTEVPRADVLVDPAVNGWDVDANDAVIRDLGADQLMLYAETVAAWAVENRMEVLTECTDLSPICRVGIVRDLGLRVFRRPLTDEEMLRYDELAADAPDLETYLYTLLAAMLQSPHFLYRMEVGEPVEGEPGVVRLTPYELASALSFLVTNSAPDAALLEAARMRRLESDEDLDRELDRLLATPRGRQTLGRFVRQWLMIDDLERRPKDPSATDFTPAVRASMLRETEAFFVDVFESDGGFADLFASPRSFVDAPLADYYGLPAPSGDELTPVDVTAAGRPAGVLGHGSVLARHALADSSSPVQRGLLVRRRFLCEEVSPPPPSVDTSLPEATEPTTTRERYAQHTSDAFCYGCHRSMDPIGFSLEHYDGFGRRRDDENGYPIDATGWIHDSADGDVPLDGAESLSRYLAVSPEARSCFARNLAYFAFGVEGCTYATVIDGFDADTPLRALWQRIVRSRHFRHRLAEPE